LYDKGDRLLEVATNVRFNPEHFPGMSLRTMEKKLVKTIFPDGHRTADLTRPEDGDQKIIFHYIPFTERVRRQLSRRAPKVPRKSRSPWIRPGELRNLV